MVTGAGWCSLDAARCAAWMLSVGITRFGGVRIG